MKPLIMLTLFKRLSWNIKVGMKKNKAQQCNCNDRNCGKPITTPNKTLNQYERIEQRDANGKLVRIWDGSKEAAMALRLDSKLIADACENKSEYGGFTWSTPFK